MLVFVLVCFLFVICHEGHDCIAFIVVWMFNTVNILWPILTAQKVGLQCVIMVFPAHARLRFQ